jgi:hypothetical protein
VDENLRRKLKGILNVAQAGIDGDDWQRKCALTAIRDTVKGLLGQETPSIESVVVDMWKNMPKEE